MKSVHQELEVTDMTNMKEDAHHYYREVDFNSDRPFDSYAECEEECDAMDAYYKGMEYEDCDADMPRPPRKYVARKEMPSKMDKMFVEETSKGMVKDFRAMKSKKGSKC